MRNIYFFIISVFLLNSSCSKTLPGLEEILDHFPKYENFQYSFVTKHQNIDNPEEFTIGNGSVAYYRLNQGHEYDYAYFVQFQKPDTSFIHTSILYDGVNYLRLHHYSDMYVLGENNNQSIHSYQGNIHAINELLSFINTGDSIRYTISSDNNLNELIIDFSIEAVLFLDIPVKLMKSEKVETSKISIALSKDSFFPKSFTNTLLYSDGKTQTYQFTFNEPVMIESQAISAIDSIPPGYQQPEIKHSKSINDLIGSKFPDYKLNSLENLEYSVDMIKGKVILFDFFALWCGPCKMATSDVIALKDSINSINFEILCVDILEESEIDKLTNYKNLKGIDYPILLNGKQLHDKIGITSIPTFVLVNNKGQIIDVQIGYSKNMIYDLEKKIVNILSEI